MGLWSFYLFIFLSLSCSSVSWWCSLIIWMLKLNLLCSKLKVLMNSSFAFSLMFDLNCLIFDVSKAEFLILLFKWNLKNESPSSLCQLMFQSLMKLNLKFISPFHWYFIQNFKFRFPFLNNASSTKINSLFWSISPFFINLFTLDQVK